MKSTALVSCIMPTKATRRHFLPLAVNCFLSQDYPNMELLILDDNDNSCAPVYLPADARIRYERVSSNGLSTGSKRNEACSRAKGDIIVHMDDDDWYAGDWVSRQVALLETTGASICGLNKLLFYQPLQQKAWIYTYVLDNRPWVAGATMAYRRTYWEKNRFRDMWVGEDNEFIWHCKDRYATLDYMEGFVSIIHPGNTSGKDTIGRSWTAYPVETVAGILKEQDNIYHKDFF